MDASPSVDVRLVLAVRPYLEYAIPETGRAVLSCLLGDSPREEADAALSSLCRSASPPLPPLDDGPARECLDEAKAYLLLVSRAWADHLCSCHASIARSVATLKRQRGECYRRKQEGEGSFERETDRIRLALHDSLDRVRREPEPRVLRPEPFEASCARARAFFSAPSGKEERRELLRKKEAFDAALLSLQVGLGRRFHDEAARLLSA